MVQENHNLDTLIDIVQNSNVESEILHAIHALGELKDGKAVEPLLMALKPQPLSSDADYRIQCELLFALGEIEDKRATKKLLELLINKSQELRIRITAAMALGRINDDTAVKSMAYVLADGREDESVRRYVFNALIKYPGNVAARQIIEYIKTHPEVLADG
ncbi:HEAT repeat-containing protein [Dehalogenimonas formicexedens]|uniref:HEAT repeat-containing protein n=1 Tax=Dehalogenimonas formicexedens TaxID=1839801 RepID=A0A1P8F7P3_9CHLR|nr:HEAT repeat domain-containing protein [Dehalogenimonas formicexedens]APV44470.1 HEAT repeat-containing protein [Dehalogenimonas formicexedens]